mgnify:CR=1 FL=1
MSEFKKMSTVDLITAINAANPWFVLFYTRNFLDSWEMLNTLEGKDNMIRRIYESFLKVEFKTLKIKSVRTSVNALINIIKGGRTLDALDYVMDSKKLMREYPEVWDEALALLDDIADGKYNNFAIPLY